MTLPPPSAPAPRNSRLQPERPRPGSLCRCASPLGPLILATDAAAHCLCGLWFEDQPLVPRVLQDEQAPPDLEVLEQTRAWLELYFRGEEPPFCPPLQLRGTPFRREVWQLLLEIPYGRSVSYGALAARLAQRRERGKPAARAIGGAVGHNPIALIIPCHRVIGSDGSLTGYAGGLQRKRWLLELESGHQPHPLP